MTSESNVNRRPVALFAAAMALAAGVSMLTVPERAGIGLLWLPTSVMLVGLLTRGPAVLLPGIIGLTLSLYGLGASSLLIAGSALGVVAGPLATLQVIERLRRFRRAQSHLVQATQMFLAIGLVQAPIAAACMAAASPLDGFHVASAWQNFLALWIIEAMTGVLSVRALMTWMPNDGSGFCPAAGMRQGLGRIDLVKLAPFLALAALGVAAWVAVETQQHNLARLLCAPVFGVAAICSLTHSRRIASTAMLAAFIVIAAVRVRFGGHVPMNGHFFDLAELSMMMLSGAALLHLLNALIEERLLQQRRLRRKAFSNEISGWPNLRALTARLLGAAERRRSMQQGMQLAEVAITGLDKWADLAGRQATMQADREIGARLQSVFGDRLTMIAHIGSGRFVLLFARAITDDRLLDLMRSGFARHRFTIANQAVPLRYSIGMVDAPPGLYEPEALLASLSLAQQQAATHNGRFYRLLMNNDQVRAYREELAFVERVRGLLERDRLRIFAQPIAPAVMSADSGLHFEILARMATEDGEILAPYGFLSAISKAGLQNELDRQVIQRTLGYLNDNLDLLDATELCAINVTGPTICDPGFASFLQAELSRCRVSPHQLAIEITESDTIADLDTALANVQAVNALGIRVAVDDFGTGQATFEYIRRLSPNLLKIDGSFVRNYREQALDREIVQSVVRLARAIGARTVAEFVESEDIAEEMRRIGVDFLQGYAIAKPMPIAQIKPFCDARREALRLRQTAAQALDYQV